MPSELDCTIERWLLRWAKICYGFGLDPILSMTSLWANSGFRPEGSSVMAVVFSQLSQVSLVLLAVEIYGQKPGLSKLYVIRQPIKQKADPAHEPGCQPRA